MVFYAAYFCTIVFYGNILLEFDFTFFLSLQVICRSYQLILYSLSISYWQHIVHLLSLFINQNILFYGGEKWWAVISFKVFQQNWLIAVTSEERHWSMSWLPNHKTFHPFTGQSRFWTESMYVTLWTMSNEFLKEPYILPNQYIYVSTNIFGRFNSALYLQIFLDRCMHDSIMALAAGFVIIF